MKVHICNAIGCRALILPREIFCGRHAAMLQSDIRTILHRHYRPQGKQSIVFNVTLERARNEILYAQTVGHKVPREADFEW